MPPPRAANKTVGSNSPSLRHSEQPAASSEQLTRDYSSVPDFDALGPQERCLAFLTPGNESAARIYDPPPRQTFCVLEEVANGPGRPREAGLLGDLAVADYLSGLEPFQDLDGRGSEGLVHALSVWPPQAGGRSRSGGAAGGGGHYSAFSPGRQNVAS